MPDRQFYAVQIKEKDTGAKPLYISKKVTTSGFICWTKNKDDAARYEPLPAAELCHDLRQQAKKQKNGDRATFAIIPLIN